MSKWPWWIWLLESLNLAFQIPFQTYVWWWRPRKRKRMKAQAAAMSKPGIQYWVSVPPPEWGPLEPVVTDEDKKKAAQAILDAYGLTASDIGEVSGEGYTTLGPNITHTFPPQPGYVKITVKSPPSQVKMALRIMDEHKVHMKPDHVEDTCAICQKVTAICQKWPWVDVGPFDWDEWKGHEGMAYHWGGGASASFPMSGNLINDLTFEPSYSVTEELAKLVPAIETAEVRCPAAGKRLARRANWSPNAVPPKCGYGKKKSSLNAIIIHLNDGHKWTREQIADWLDTLDIDLTLQPAATGD